MNQRQKKCLLILMGLLLIPSVAAWAAGDAAHTAAQGEWTAYAPLPIPTGVSLTTTMAYDGLLYEVGGTLRDPDLRSPQLWSYNPAEDAWTRKADIPYLHGMTAYGAGVAYNGYLYIFGGIIQAQALNTTWIYDIANDIWWEGAPMPGPRFSPAVAVIGDKIYVVGGHDLQDAQATTWEYDPQKDAYTEKAPLPQPRFRLQGVSGGDKERAEMHVFGGFFDPSEHQIYDVLSDTWRSAPPIPASVFGPAVVRVGQRIYVVGGSGTQIYDLSEETWSEGPRLPFVIRSTSGAAVGNVIYVVGGFNNVRPINTNLALTVP